MLFSSPFSSISILQRSIERSFGAISIAFSLRHRARGCSETHPRDSRLGEGSAQLYVHNSMGNFRSFRHTKAPLPHWFGFSPSGMLRSPHFAFFALRVPRSSVSPAAPGAPQFCSPCCPLAWPFCPLFFFFFSFPPLVFFCFFLLRRWRVAWERAAENERGPSKRSRKRNWEKKKKKKLHRGMFDDGDEKNWILRLPFPVVFFSSIVYSSVTLVWFMAPLAT